MATVAHCAYCFECLSASLDKRKPLSLVQVERLWEQYENREEHDDAAAAAQLKSEAGQAAGTTTDGTEESDRRRDGYKPAAISRLLNTSSTSSSYSSSSSSFSSTPSASSSTPSLSSTNSASSRSSLSSLSRRLGRGRQSTGGADDEEYPLFVTWNTVNSRGHKSLRGCIGTFEPQELDDGLRSYALTSAFDDTRFHPISASELSILDCGITLLTNFETIRDPMDWNIGQHGLRISFSHLGRRFGATYLPDVAREQGWTKEETGREDEMDD